MSLRPVWPTYPNPVFQKEKQKGPVELTPWVRVPATKSNNRVTHFTKDDMVKGES